MRENHRDVGEVQGWGGDAEDGSGGLRRANGDAVEGYTESDGKPDGVDGGLGILVHLCKCAVFYGMVNYCPSCSVRAQLAHLENGSASSRANAYAIRVFASMAEHPVKNWTRIVNPTITVPPVLPPALRKI